jgi:hypothetical protein
MVFLCCVLSHAWTRKTLGGYLLWSSALAHSWRDEFSDRAVEFYHRVIQMLSFLPNVAIRGKLRREGSKPELSAGGFDRFFFQSRDRAH